MRFCFIDDDKIFLNFIEKTIIKYSIHYNFGIKTIYFDTIPSDIPEDIDAFFLDIEIGDDTIFSFISKIREDNLLVPIIILTNHDVHIFNTVKYNIFDFIRKDQLENDLIFTLNRLMDFIDKALPSIIIEHNETLVRIKISDIKFIKLESHFTKLYTRKGVFEVYKDKTAVFKDKIKFFVKIHRSYYINPAYLLNIKGNKLILQDNIILPIGIKYKKGLFR